MLRVLQPFNGFIDSQYAHTYLAQYSANPHASNSPFHQGHEQLTMLLLPFLLRPDKQFSHE